MSDMTRENPLASSSRDELRVEDGDSNKSASVANRPSQARSSELAPDEGGTLASRPVSSRTLGKAGISDGIHHEDQQSGALGTMETTVDGKVAGDQVHRLASTREEPMATLTH